jgi:gamma-glutamylcyclotransferase (GGCT)/AIG2-like uncharacterized protein YtfP
MHYFSYGSNLDPQQMSLRCPGATVVGLGELRDHRLTFPLTSHDWGGGVASVGVAHGESVWGVVYELTDEHMAALDRYEQFVGPGDQHNLYDRETTSVQLVRADDGSFPRRLRPWIYLARSANPARPSRRYLDTVLAGAHHHRLPEEYVAKLAATPVLD